LSKTEHEKILDAAKKQAVDDFILLEHSPIKQRLESIEATLEASYQTKIAQLPDEWRGLVPDGMTVDQKLSHVDKLISTLVTQKNLTLGAPANPGPATGKRTYTMAEIRELGKDPAEWLKVRDDVMAAKAEGRIVQE